MGPERLGFGNPLDEKEAGRPFIGSLKVRYIAHDVDAAIRRWRCRDKNDAGNLSQRRLLEDSCVVRATGLAAAEPPLSGRRSFEEFFVAFYQRLAKAMLLLTGNRAEAEELAQDAFVRVYERWKRVAAMESPEGYLFRTAMNLHRKRLRRLAIRGRRYARMGEAPDQLHSAEIKADILRALSGLRDGHREVLVLVDWLGLGSDEAAKVLGVSGQAARARLHRARAALRDALGGSYE